MPSSPVYTVEGNSKLSRLCSCAWGKCALTAQACDSRVRPEYQKARPLGQHLEQTHLMLDVSRSHKSAARQAILHTQEVVRSFLQPKCRPLGSRRPGLLSGKSHYA
jgi:hypothetical protein